MLLGGWSRDLDILRLYLNDPPFRTGIFYGFKVTRGWEPALSVTSYITKSMASLRSGFFWGYLFGTRFGKGDPDYRTYNSNASQFAVESIVPKRRRHKTWMVLDGTVVIVCWLDLVGGLEHFLFSIIYMGQSFPLTNSYFSRWLKPPTSMIQCCNSLSIPCFEPRPFFPHRIERPNSSYVLISCFLFI